STGFDAAWELDFWGKFRRSIEAADARLQVSIQDYDDLLVTLIAETASAYVEFRTFEERIRLAQLNVKAQEGMLEIAKSRYASGVTDEMDVYQAETNVANTQAKLPQLEVRRREAEIRLCVLMGIPPHELAEQLGTGPIPRAPTSVVVGIPADLLRRRPDIRRAEWAAAEQSARIGVAAAELLPQFALRGTIRYESNQFDDLFRSLSSAGIIAPGFRWDVLNYGRLKNNVLLQDARFQRLLTAYEQTVLEANADVERALVAFIEGQREVEYLSNAVAANRKALKIATDQYRLGDTNYNQIFTLQAFVVEEEDALAEAKGAVARSLIRVYKALGGGWQLRCGQGCELTEAVTEVVEGPVTADVAPEPIFELLPDTGGDIPPTPSEPSLDGLPMPVDPDLLFDGPAAADAP
ncbi:MAG: efflux transporter outer membrane subunit, partial [Planctomycetota bacterium]